MVEDVSRGCQTKGTLMSLLVDETARNRRQTHPGNLEVSENTTRYITSNTPVLDLRGSRVAVHLGELELCLRACTEREGSIPDDVAEGLSRYPTEY